MTELERKILQTFAEAFPGMTEAEKDRLLCFGEGMAAMTEAKAPAAPAVEDKPEEPAS